MSSQIRALRISFLGLVLVGALTGVIRIQAQVREAARTYIRNFSFAYVGDPARLDRSLVDRF